MLTILNDFKTISFDNKPLGNIINEQNHTPNNQLVDKSEEERLL